MADVNELGFSLAPFSSRGPTRDNRMKPDISAPGVNIMAPQANSINQSIQYSVTSMATPFDGLTPPGAPTKQKHPCGRTAAGVFLIHKRQA